MEIKITIDRKEYSLVEVESKPKYKNGDFLRTKVGEILIFKGLTMNGNVVDHACLLHGNVILNNIVSNFLHIERHCTPDEKEKMLDALKEKGKHWNAEKLCVEDISEEPKEGDLCIFWDYYNHEYAFISYYKKKCRTHYDISNMHWDNAIKWDGTKKQFKRVLRGAL